MVTCSDDILLRSYLRHRNVTERHSSAKPGGREDTDVFFVFCFSARRPSGLVVNLHTC